MLACRQEKARVSTLYQQTMAMLAHSAASADYEAAGAALTNAKPLSQKVEPRVTNVNSPPARQRTKLFSRSEPETL